MSPFILTLAAAAASAISDDWPAAAELSRRSLDRMRSDAPVGAERWLDAWSRIVEAGCEAARRQLLAEGEEADDMRQMSPFAGVLTETERRAALAAADALS